MSRARRVADQIVEMLHACGVRRVFGVPGGTIGAVFDALLDAEIQVVACQHETMAVYMAAGHARVTGTIGTVLVTSGPGILNAITGVAAAFHDEVPIVLVAGDVARSSAGRGALQDGGAAGLDALAMFRSITRFAATPAQPSQAAVMLRHAIAIATSRPQGPVLLNLPVDIAAAPAAGGPAYFASSSLLAAPSELTARIADMLVGARRPLLYLGLGARLCRVERVVRQIALATHCPVVCDTEAKGLFPESHPLSLGLLGIGGQASHHYLSRGVDAIVSVGARFDDTNTMGWSPMLRPAGGTLVQLDYDPRRLGRAYATDLAVACDLGPTLERIRDQLAQMPASTLSTRMREVAEASAQRDVVDAWTLSRSPHPPPAVIHALQHAAGPDAVFVCDIGNHMLFAARHLVLDHPDSFHVAQGLGGMGSGIGMAMGMALAHGGRRPVIGICGDGGLAMFGNELSTCARYRIPVALAVLDDGQYGMVRHGLERVYGRSDPWRLPKLDLSAYGRALGVDVVRVEAAIDLPPLHELRAPLLLDIPIDPEFRAANPREQAIHFAAGARVE